MELGQQSNAKQKDIYEDMKIEWIKDMRELLEHLKAAMVDICKIGRSTICLRLLGLHSSSSMNCKEKGLY